MSNNEEKLSVLGHLGELRKRLIRSLIAVVITSILSFIFYEQIFDILIFKDMHLISVDITELLQAIKLTETLGTIMRVSLVSGIILAMPFLTYELIMFVSPALTSREKKYVYLILPWIVLMFAAGVVFAYFIVVPKAINFLMTFGSDIVTIRPTISDYINVVTRFLLVIGLVFEMPVLTTFLARLGILKPKWLADKRKAAIIVAFILAAMITPTIDPGTQSLVAVPLIILYEMSIWLAKLVYRKEPRTVTSVSSPAS